MSLSGMLKRRGFKLLSRDPTARLIFPEKFSEAYQDELYRLLQGYGFRTFLKDVIQHREGFDVPDLVRYCSAESAQRYLEELRALQLAEPAARGGYRLIRARAVDSLGDTLEWFLARLLLKELDCEAWWNVVLAPIPSGGDFDVLTDCENRLLYLEVKSSPPKSIEKSNLESFLRRVGDLRPDAAIFFEDTTLRMRDKILPFFSELLGPGKEFEAIQDETYRSGNLFLTNSKPGILESIGFCLTDLLRGRGIDFSD